MTNNKRSRQDLSQGEVVSFSGAEDSILANATVSPDCFAYKLVNKCCPGIDKTSLLQTAMGYFVRAKDLYSAKQLKHWMVSPEGISIPRPRSDVEVDVLVDFLIFCDIAAKVFGADASTFDCGVCCERLYRFFDKKDISKREFHLLSFGLHFNFDRHGI
jgi:hypothetical protein